MPHVIDNTNLSSLRNRQSDLQEELNEVNRQIDEVTNIPMSDEDQQEFSRLKNFFLELNDDLQRINIDISEYSLECCISYEWEGGWNFCIDRTDFTLIAPSNLESLLLNSFDDCDIFDMLDMEGIDFSFEENMPELYNEIKDNIRKLEDLEEKYPHFHDKIRNLY